MIHLHQIIDQFGTSYGTLQLRAHAAQAVQFDCGDIDQLPTLGEFEPAFQPYPFIYLEFLQNADVPLLVAAFVRQGSTPTDIEFRWFGKEFKSNSEWVAPDGAKVHFVKGEADGTFTVDGVHDLSDPGGNRYIAISILKIFTVMACSNVIYLDNTPSYPLNKKRARSGKVPISTYKTLHLSVPNDRVAGPDLGGSHASPRIHLRRGHIRKLESGKTVWVRPSVVGSKHGIVSKDYRLVTKNA